MIRAEVSNIFLRREAIAIILDCVTNELLVTANGFISREAYSHQDRSRNFYMLGSMGLAGPIGLGIALAQPNASVVILDGDGNLLMGFGGLPMVGAWQPNHFLHVVLDNGTYGSTGGQPTISLSVDFPAAALSCGYQRAISLDTEELLQKYVIEWLTLSGPSLIHVHVSSLEPTSTVRVLKTPPAIARRFTESIRGLGK